MKITDSMKQDMHKRLKEIIGKKINTTMIYPLSQFEMAFGYLWGFDKPIETLTQEQVLARDKWRQCRNNILNMGNQQKRNAFTELDMHEVIWKRYQYSFLPIEQYNKYHNQEEIGNE